MSDPADRLTARSVLADLVRDSAESFQVRQSILSFDEFLQLVELHPHRYARSSAQYLLDTIQYFGTEQVSRGGRVVTRWRVFDAPFDDGDDRVVGQEEAQQHLVTLLNNFANERRINRLLLLHGPNGSAKSSLVSCLMRALEAYSLTEEGALYRFNWVFPGRIQGGRRLGFGADNSVVPSESFAHLDDAAVDARLAAEHNDNPLFLLPSEARMRLLQTASRGGVSMPLADHIRKGDLGQRSRAVFDALLASYRGDLRRVYCHVQVERFSISKRYRRGAVTVEPQLRVDAGVRQLTADRSLNALPSALQTQTLFETFGPLVEGNRGLIEFNDFLKRPAEANKYLLSTSEKGTVALEHGEMRLDAVLLATANEVYLEAFKQQPDWASYKGRFELVRMPYLLDFRAETAIYDDLLKSVNVSKPIAPHTTRVLALWAVLTRLRKPNPSTYPSRMQSVVGALSPLDKALLYADGTVPPGLASELAAELRSLVPRLLEEGADGANYEGRFGASAREMKSLLLSGLHTHSPTLSPAVVCQELERLVRDRSVYEWLQLEADGEYRRPEKFVRAVHDFWVDSIEREVRQATGMVDESEYRRLFERYISHINYWLRGEKLTDPVSGQSVQPDERLMGEVEQSLGRKEEARGFRSMLISQIAAFRIDNPDDAVDYERIFPRQIEQLREQYHRSRRAAVARVCQVTLQVRAKDAGGAQPQEIEQSRLFMERLCSDYGYVESTALEVVSTLLRSRYASLV